MLAYVKYVALYICDNAYVNRSGYETNPDCYNGAKRNLTHLLFSSASDIETYVRNVYPFSGWTAT